MLKAGVGEEYLRSFDAFVACVENEFRSANGAVTHADVSLVEDYDGLARRALMRLDRAVLEGRVRGLFSGEEGLGRYFDVEEVFGEVGAGWKGVEAAWLKTQRRVDAEGNGDANVDEEAPQPLSFATYLVSLGEGHQEAFSTSFKMKNHGKYVGYLERVVEYLGGLYGRSNPLKEWGAVERDVDTAFEVAWEGAEGVEGIKTRWESAGGRRGAASDGSGGWEDAYESVEALEEGMDGEEMKVVLASMGLKCGGTVRQRAERLWSVRGKAVEEIDPSLFAGAGGKKKKKNKTTSSAAGVSTDAAKTSAISTAKTIAKLEFTIRYLCTTSSLLEKQYKATIEKLEKRHAQTHEEFQADMEAELENDVAENAFANEDDEDERDVHNPLKIPLGVDGKPIPYWMYKLHGLNHEFPCEICGNATYCGRRQFEKHFTEAKHVAGLRALGIPNSRQFYEITSISEALGLWNAIQGRKEKGATVEEEVEDEEGNIMSREMLTQMQMQGLL